MEWQAEGFDLLEKQAAANSVHTDSIVTFGNRGQQASDADIVALAEGMQGQGAVFAAAPTE
jgi:hypothetical protein